MTDETEIAGTNREGSYRKTLRQLRKMVQSIQGGDDPREFVEALRESLETAGIDFDGYGVNLIDETTEGIRITQHALGPDGKAFDRVRTAGTSDLLTGWWRDGRTVYRRDLEADDPYGELASWAGRGSAPRRSIVDVPFSGGTLGINSLNPNAFSDADLEFFQDLADVLAAATQRWHDLNELEERNALLARQVEEGRHRTEELGKVNAALAEKERLLAGMHETGKVLLGSLDRDHILDILALQIIQAGIFRGLMVALVDDDRNKVRVARSFNRKRDESGKWRLVDPRLDIVGIEYDLDDDNVTAEVARTGRMVVIDGWDQRFDKRINRSGNSDKISYFIPVIHNGRSVAVLATGSEPSEREEMLRTIEVLGPFFDLFAIALHHADLYHDLQERERELRESQKMEIMGELTAGIAHNFNNLLQGLVGNLEFALESPDEAAALIKRAMKSSDSLTEMVRQLMSYSRRGLATDRVPTDLALVVDSVSRVCRSSFDRRIEVVTQIADGVPLVDGNADQLEQVLLNLCVNARDGVTEVTERTPKIEISLSPAPNDERDMVVLRVRDNGVGIESAIQARVFDPFFTTKDVGRGTGLGLSSVHGIVRHHGGWVTCDSKPGEGTTFEVYLNAAAASTPVPTDSAPTRAWGKGTILLMDDEEAVRHVVQGHLERCGYEVLLAVDGEEGLRMLSDRCDDIDLVLLDLWMPKVSGHEVLERMAPEQPQPVILFSGYAIPEDVDERVVATLEKPIPGQKLVDCVTRVMQEQRPQDPSQRSQEG